MTAFGALEKLFTKNVDGFAPTNDKFVRPHREETAKSLRLRERGAEQGELNLPPSDAKEFDVVEREIIGTVREHLNEAHIDAGNNVRSYESRLADLGLLYGLSAIRGEVVKTLGDIDLHVREWRDRLATQEEEIRQANEELREFQRKHELRRPFHIVESAWTHFALILLAFLLETAGNTIFLSENNDMGIAGGIVSAALVSFLNVGMATAAGVFIFRRLNYQSKGKKIFAGILILGWMAITLIWNLLAGHFRDSQSAGSDNPQLEALQLFAQSPFGFESFYSWAMLLIGLLAAAFSAWKGYGMDDPYPGYGPLGRRFKAREELYADMVAEARERLAAERDEAIASARRIQEELGVQMRTRGRVLAAYDQLIHRYAQHHAQLEDLTNYLLKVYQDANRRSRSEPAPGYFDQPFKLDCPELARLNAPPLDQSQVDAADAELRKAIEQVAGKFESGINSFTAVHDLKTEAMHVAA